MSYYAQVVDVPAPPGVYDATHAELLRRTGGHIDGLLVHLCRATEDGFQVLEVWTDRVACERADRDIVAPILAEQAPATPGTPILPPHIEEFAVRGLVVPGSGIATWKAPAMAAAGAGRSEAGRHPHDRALNELIGELATHSAPFAALWAGHDVRIHTTGTKRFHHPVAGDLSLQFETLDLPGDHGQTLFTFTAEPGSAS